MFKIEYNKLIQARKARPLSLFKNLNELEVMGNNS